MQIKPILFRLTIIALALSPFAVKAQSIPVPDFDVADKGKALIKEDANGYYFSSTGANGDTVFYCKDMSCYKVIDSNGRVVINGEITASSTAHYIKNGKWAEFYRTGIPKSVAYYCLGDSAGMVQTYYPNSTLSSRYNMALIKTKTTQSFKSGLYQEFYENGQKKLEGFYRINTEGKNPVSEKTGKWFEYDANGKRIKEQTY